MKFSSKIVRQVNDCDDTALTTVFRYCNVNTVMHI